jgi:hypothetical protein
VVFRGDDDGFHSACLECAHPCTGVELDGIEDGGIHFSRAPFLTGKGIQTEMNEGDGLLPLPGELPGSRDDHCSLMNDAGLGLIRRKKNISLMKWGLGNTELVLEEEQSDTEYAEPCYSQAIVFADTHGVISILDARQKRRKGNRGSVGQARSYGKPIEINSQAGTLFSGEFCLRFWGSKARPETAMFTNRKAAR